MTYPEPEERETLLRAIDVLSIEVLRLKSENNALTIKIQTLQKNSLKIKPKNLTLWTKAVNFYHREGLKKTIKKAFSKIVGK